MRRGEGKKFPFPSGPEGDGVLELLAAEVLGAVFGHLLGRVLLAAEDVDEGAVGVLSEVTGDQRGLYELCQGVTLHPGVGAESYHDGFPEPLHIDVLAEVDRELLYVVTITDLLRVAIMDVDGYQKTPFLALLVSLDHLLVGH